MYGTLSQSNSGRGIKFHRVMALSGVIGVSLFAFAFIGILGSRELIWDRCICLLLALAIYIRGYFPGINASQYARWVIIMFYVHTTQILWSVIWNDFDVFYFLSLFITGQAYVYALRNESQAFWFLLYICVISLLGLSWVSNLEPHDKTFFAFTIVVTTSLQYMASRIKCRFIREMRMNQELLQSLVTKTETAIFMTDINGNIFDINPRVTELFGYERDELIDRDFKILRKDNLTNDEIEFGLTELEKSRFWNTQTRLVKKGGAEFHVRTSIALIKNGVKKYLVYRVQDMTFVKENEAKIIVAKENAEEAAIAKSQFLAIMSHEIRTPLNGVIATASLLQQTDLNLEQEDYTNTIRKSGQSLLMLINDILEFSKMESGKMMLDPHPSNPQEIIFDVCDLLRPHAENKGIDLRVNMNSSIPERLLLDSHRLKQVLINLTGNAIKFTDRGAVELNIENAELIHDSVTLRFEVKDSGIGIAKDKMHLLFQSFTQVDSSTSRKYGGTGLGLAISRQLIELMGGEVSVSSEEGVGTTFSFSVKCSVLAAEKSGTQGKELKNKNDLFDFSDMKVLVAEDNEINKEVFRYMLDSIHVQSDFADDGTKVLEACINKEYDVIFMDMQMPVMDGLQATRAIRSAGRHQPVIVAITANTFKDDRQHCTDAGMNDFLCKPFDVDQLRDVLMRWKNATGDLINPAA